MKLPSLTLSPEFKAQGNGVAIAAVLGVVASVALGLPSGMFLLLVPVAMGLLGIAFAAVDALRENAGKTKLATRLFFWRGVSEGVLAFLLNLGLAAVRGAQ